MTLPPPVLHPPTDSLYKFAAIFGLVLIVTSIWGAVQTNNEYALRSIEASAFLAAHQAELLSVSRKETDLLHQMIQTNDRGEMARLQSEFRALKDAPPPAVPEYHKLMNMVEYSASIA